MLLIYRRCESGSRQWLHPLVLGEHSPLPLRDRVLVPYSQRGDQGAAREKSNENQHDALFARPKQAILGKGSVDKAAPIFARPFEENQKKS
jgi:hypothetical protein